MLNSATPLCQDMGLALLEPLRILNIINSVPAQHATPLNSNNTGMPAAHSGYMAAQSYNGGLQDNMSTYPLVDFTEKVPQAVTSQ